MWERSRWTLGFVGSIRRRSGMDALLLEEGLPRRERRSRKRSISVMENIEADQSAVDVSPRVQRQPDEDPVPEASERLAEVECRGEQGMEGTYGMNFEYRDHTADIQLHAWGTNMSEAFENAGLAMFNYMTPLKGVNIDPTQEKVYRMQAHDMQSLLFAFLDELLFIFNTEFFVCKAIRIVKFDRETWEIEARGSGETFSPETHAMGTEIKAITYSAMQVVEEREKSEVYVIVDI